MSKDIKPTIYIDDYVCSVKHARDMADRAVNEQNRIKGDIFSLVMATPKDITPINEEPHEYLREKLDGLWEELFDAFIDDYKYTIVADDAEYLSDSLVKESWEKEEVERKLLREKEDKMKMFFDKYKHVFDRYNMDDISIYEACSDGEITIPSPEEITINDREEILRRMKEKEDEILRKTLEKIKDGK